MVGHFDQPVDPEVPFLNRGLVGREVAVDYKQVCLLADSVIHEPTQAPNGVTKISVFLQMYVSAVVDAEGHRSLLSVVDVVT